MDTKKLPIGIENFEKLRKEEFYYIDKTGMIKELLNRRNEVNLFTRPRRFGKSLNMSMLKNFFEFGNDKRIFEGLEISREKELCEKYMGKFPVISLSLKGVNACCYENAWKMAVQIINGEARKFQYLLESERLTQHEKDMFVTLLKDDMAESLLENSLKMLSKLLNKHHDHKVIILIDEYDVPLAKAFEHGYYDKMIELLRKFFGQALKKNDSLYLAVLTGCIQISKESVFTGFNNLKAYSIIDEDFDECFGFTKHEIKELLEYYYISSKHEILKEWYGGYRFGNTEIYCPWDVVCYCNRLRQEPDGEPESYWSNTSGNDVVCRLIQMAEKKDMLKQEIELLVAGEIIEKEIILRLTYEDVYSSENYIWSILLATGYLTQRGKRKENVFRLAIPNLEIRKIFTTQIWELFKESVRKNGEAVNGFCEALKCKDVRGAEKQLNEYLRKNICIHDTFMEKTVAENGGYILLLTILEAKGTWSTYSHRGAEEEDRYILAEIDEENTGIVLKIQKTEDGNLESRCRKVMEQLDKIKYESLFYDGEINNVLKYGIVYDKRRRMVMIDNVKIGGIENEKSIAYRC